MLLSIAENDDLIIRKVDLDTAWDILQTIERDMGKTFSAVGKYEHANYLQIIIAHIRREGGLTAEALHSKFYAMGDIQDLGKMLLMGIQMGAIKRVKEDDVTWYRPA